MPGNLGKIRIKQINKSLLILINKLKIFYQKNYVGQQFCNYSYDLNFLLMNYWINKKFLFLIKGFFLDIFSLLSVHDFQIKVFNDEHNKNKKVLITWANHNSFDKYGNIRDKYFNEFYGKKNVEWVLVSDTIKKPLIIKKCKSKLIYFYLKRKNIILRVLFLFRVVINNLFFFFIKKNRIIFLLKNNFKYIFANLFLKKIKNYLDFNNKIIYMPYEGQPFQKLLIKYIKNNFMNFKIIGYVHSFPSLPTHLLKSFDSPNELIVNCYDQKDTLSNYLGWKKKDIFLKKSSRFFGEKKITPNIYFPIDIYSYQKILSKFNFLINNIFSDYSFENLDVVLHPHNSNSKVQNNFKNKILVMINSTKNRNKKLYNKVIVIGSSSTVIEALMYNYEVIHIVENEELEIYSNLFWKNINLDFLSEGIIQYKSINKKRFFFKKNKEKINYI
jgi:hypothetical protein